MPRGGQGGQNSSSQASGELPLPSGWDLGKDYDGKVYFINHNLKQTTWIDPRDSLTKPQSFADCVGDELPVGWEQVIDYDRGVYYVNHVDKQVQLEDPRLEWRALQEEMLRDYLTTAQEDLQAKRELVAVKQARLSLAQDEFRNLKTSLSTSNTSRLELHGTSYHQSWHQLPTPVTNGVLYLHDGPLRSTDWSRDQEMLAAGGGHQSRSMTELAAGSRRPDGYRSRIWSDSGPSSVCRVSTPSLNSTNSCSSTKYDPDLIKSDVAHAKARVQRLKQELANINSEMQYKARGVETLASVNNKMTDPSAGLTQEEANAIRTELQSIQKSLVTGEMEKIELIKSLACLKEDLTRLEPSESSLDVSLMNSQERFSTASQTDLSGEMVPVGARLAQLARLRLQYDESRRHVQELQQRLASLEERISPGQLESDNDRLLLIQEKEQLLRELRSINSRSRTSGEMEAVRSEIRKLEADLNRAMEISNKCIAERLKIHEEKRYLLQQLKDSMRAVTSLEGQLKLLSASTLSMSSSSSLGSLSSHASSKGSLASLSFTDIYGMTSTTVPDSSMLDLHRRVEKILIGTNPSSGSQQLPTSSNVSSHFSQQQHHHQLPVSGTAGGPLACHQPSNAQFTSQQQQQQQLTGQNAGHTAPPVSLASAAHPLSQQLSAPVLSPQQPQAPTAGSHNLMPGPKVPVQYPLAATQGTNLPAHLAANSTHGMQMGVVGGITSQYITSGGSTSSSSGVQTELSSPEEVSQVESGVCAQHQSSASLSPRSSLSSVSPPVSPYEAPTAGQPPSYQQAYLISKERQKRLQQVHPNQHHLSTSSHNISSASAASSTASYPQQQQQPLSSHSPIKRVVGNLNAPYGSSAYKQTASAAAASYANPSQTAAVAVAGCSSNPSLDPTAGPHLMPAPLSPICEYRLSSGCEGPNVDDTVDEGGQTGSRQYNYHQRAVVSGVQQPPQQQAGAARSHGIASHHSPVHAVSAQHQSAASLLPAPTVMLTTTAGNSSCGSSSTGGVGGAVSAAVSNESVAGDSGVFEAASSQGRYRRQGGGDSDAGHIDGPEFAEENEVGEDKDHGKLDGSGVLGGMSLETAQVQIKLRYSGSDSLLHVGIERARNLAALFIPESRNVCIKVSLLPSASAYSCTFCTRAVSELDKPTFGENFPMAVSRSKLTNKTLQVNVWAVEIGGGGREDCLGSTQVSMADFNVSTTCVKWYNILSFHFMQPEVKRPVQAVLGGRTVSQHNKQESDISCMTSSRTGTLKEESSDESTIISSQTSTLTRNIGADAMLSEGQPGSTHRQDIAEDNSEDEDSRTGQEDDIEINENTNSLVFPPTSRVSAVRGKPENPAVSHVAATRSLASSSSIRTATTSSYAKLRTSIVTDSLAAVSQLSQGRYSNVKASTAGNESSMSPSGVIPVFTVDDEPQNSGEIALSQMTDKETNTECVFVQPPIILGGSSSSGAGGHGCGSSRTSRLLSHSSIVKRSKTFSPSGPINKSEYNCKLNRSDSDSAMPLYRRLPFQRSSRERRSLHVTSSGALGPAGSHHSVLLGGGAHATVVGGEATNSGGGKSKSFGGKSSHQQNKTTVDLELDLAAQQSRLQLLREEIERLRTIKERLEESKARGDKEIPPWLQQDITFQHLLQTVENSVVEKSPEERRMEKLLRRTAKEIYKLRKTKTTKGQMDIQSFREKMAFFTCVKSTIPILVSDDSEDDDDDKLDEEEELEDDDSLCASVEERRQDVKAHHQYYLPQAHSASDNRLADHGTARQSPAQPLPPPQYDAYYGFGRVPGYDDVYATRLTGEAGPPSSAATSSRQRPETLNLARDGDAVSDVRLRPSCDRPSTASAQLSLTTTTPRLLRRAPHDVVDSPRRLPGQAEDPSILTSNVVVVVEADSEEGGTVERFTYEVDPELGAFV